MHSHLKSGSHEYHTVWFLSHSWTITSKHAWEHSYLEVKLRLESVYINGTVGDANLALDAKNTKNVCVTKDLGHTLFKQMNLYFSEIMMSAHPNTYVQSAFLETLLAKQGCVNYFNVVDHVTARKSTTTSHHGQLAT